MSHFTKSLLVITKWQVKCTTQIVRQKAKTDLSLLTHVFLPTAQQPLVGLGFLIVGASQSLSDIKHSVGLFWANDQPIAETIT
jgi:hypothetical protein